MKSLTRFSVNYPITILMVVLAVLLLGYISFTRLGMDLFPDITNPRIFIELEAGELPPEEIEQKFIEGIESQAVRQKNVLNVSSVSQVGSARVTVEYAWDTDMDNAFLDLQKALSSYEQNSDIDDLSITQYDPNASPVVLLAFSHPDITDMDELRKTAESYLRNEIIRLQGIADVTLLGEEEQEVVVKTDPYLLKAYGVTISTLSSRINNYNSNISGGSIEEMGQEYIIKGVGEFVSLDDIGNIIVTYTDNTESTETATGSGSASVRTPVFLNDLADISFRNKEPENIVRLNGQRCMGLAVYKEMKYNTVQAVEEFMTALDVIRNALPGYELTIIQNQGDFITNAINEVKETALFGILLAVVILFLFLRRIGVTFVISAAIPISIVATFNLMYFNGLTLNIMTLGGLALGAGMLVDNAIVVMENIYRNLESGLNLKEAAIEGTAQVGGAITASTLTTIVVFLPIVYLQGAAGELFKEQAWTVAFSLMSSLVVAILIIPMLASRLMGAKTSKAVAAKATGFVWYGNFLRALIRVRWVVIGIAAAAVFGAFQLVPYIGSEFIPRTNMNEYTIELNLPQGTELERTADTAENIEKSLRAVFGDALETVFSISGPSGDIIGDSGSIFEDENTATIKIVLKKDHGIPSATVLSSISGIIGKIPDIEARFIQDQAALEFTLGTEDAPIVVEILGEDLDVLQNLTDQAKARLESLDALYNVETSFEEGRPEINVVIDRVRAGLNNVSISELTSQLTNHLDGAEAGQLEDEGELKDITVELPRVPVKDLENLTLDIGSQEIRLYDVANITVTKSAKEIYRNNQTRVGKITASLAEGVPLDKAVQSIEENLGDITFPRNYRYMLSGEEQQRRESFNTLKFALILSLVLVYMVLASQFESLAHPFTIILSIPLAVVGAVIIFFVLGKTFNIMAYIGIIMLVGIAVNDSIILVDAINQLKREGYGKTDAIVEAGRRRIRPIIMTSLTTIMALLPLTVGLGEGAALRSPMALAVIGGLVTSTILTLVVIPCIYSVLDVLHPEEQPES